ARHGIVLGMTLGVLIDEEREGQPHRWALGDDNNPPEADDEDGADCTNIAPGCPYKPTFTVTAPGYIDAWVDWQGDGNWEQPGDQVFASQPVTAGTNTFTLVAPANARPGFTFARVRYSSVGGLSYKGAAPDGEVEDYLVYIQEPPKTVNIGEAKLEDLGTDVLIRSKVVTANFGEDGWYLAEQASLGGRFAGIGVMEREDWAIGDVVTVYGRTVLNGCELMITEYASILEGRTTPITSLGQTNRASGGGQLGSQPGLYDFCDGFDPPRPAYGLNSVGQLVSLWGRCTCSEFGIPPYNFWIDDGSNLWDGTWCTKEVKALGVRVRVPSGYAGDPIQPGYYYAVTGIMRTTTSWNGSCVRWLWPRTDSDIQLIPELEPR
ncbi:MAG: GEVED domain-containing protein, partial [Armatimonadetes bacterium]|nr:GEVED domain-containing protein [Armatimonadota bacterium]